MKLKRLDITGFKSFHDRASIHFPPGVSAVVGPNGCGKSNILDALRWVMGEQSPKQLRGKSMEDIIFAGADGHPPLNMAEVSLTLLNDNGSAPEELKDYAEIMLTRRLYRSGESAYFLNKRPCRLKDISNILLGSGMGAKSYAVIQQGNIGAITEAGPEERRAFVEEAAGISRYKAQKVEALRKVEATNENLVRVQDILSEINRQMSVLERQAKKAERFKNLRRQSRLLDLKLNLTRFQRLSTESAGFDARKNALLDEETKLNTELQKIDARIAGVRLQRMEKEQALSSRKNDRNTLQRQLDKLEMDAAHQDQEIRRLTGELVQIEESQGALTGQNEKLSAEIEETGAKLKKLESEWQQTTAELAEENAASTTLRERFSELNQRQEAEKKRLIDRVAREATVRNMHQTTIANRETLTRRLKRIDEEVAAAELSVEHNRTAKKQASVTLETLNSVIEVLNSRIGREKRHLEAVQADLGAQVKEVHRLQMAHHQIASRYAALKKTSDDFDWYKEGVRTLFKSPALPFPPDKLLGIVADILTPASGYENAVEAVLGDALQYVLATNLETATAAIDFLKGHPNTRAGFIPLDVIPSTGPVPRKSQPARRLLDYVGVRKGFEAVAELLLGAVYLTPDLKETAEASHHSHPDSHRIYVTESGDLMTGKGLLVGGGQEHQEGILSKKRELIDLKASEEAAVAQLSGAKDRLKKLEEDLAAIEHSLLEFTGEKQQADHQRMEDEKHLFTTTQDLEQVLAKLDILQLEQDQLAGESADAKIEMEKFHKMVEDVTQEVEGCQAAITEISSEIELLSRQMDSFQEKTLALKLRITQRKAEIDNAKSTLNRVIEFRKDATRRLNQIAQDLEMKRVRLTGIQSNRQQVKQSLESGYARFRELETELSMQQTGFSKIDENLQAFSRTATELRTSRDAVHERFQDVEIGKSRVQVKIEALEAQLMDRYGHGVAALEKAVAEASDNHGRMDEMNEEQMSEALDRLRKQIEAMGDIHLGAISEFEALQERASFLESQKNDLVRAVEDLRRVIQKINKVSVDRFLHTFEAINSKLMEIFPRLFTGGTARLVMTDPNNVLETGVEFLIHPPGKKLTRISLLSGGEKALSAIAFIFSIFLIKPASFCLLDEIDAPLDEANVHRFNHLLQMIGEKSQIVMVTHNKRSMEFADMLFGVTMENQGISKVVSVNLEKAA